MRLIDFFDKGAAINPEGPCLIEDGVEHSYRDVRESTFRIAGALITEGIGPGVKAAVYSPNTARVLDCMLGILRSGAVWVPINARNAVDENAYILDNTDCEWVFYHSDCEDEIAVIAERAPGIKGFVCIDREGRTAPSFDDWIARTKTAPIPDFPEDPDGIAAILGSGGTTGKPKGVVTTHRVWEVLVANYNANMPITEYPVHLAAAPLSHGAGGMCMPILACGGVNVIMKKADPLGIMEHIEKYKVTRLYLPPTVIYMILAHPRAREFDYSSLKYFIYAASPMATEKVKEAMELFGPVMCQNFGQTEALMNITYMSPEDHVEALARNDNRLMSCGRPSLFSQVEIMDDEGNLLGADEQGEIVVRSGNVLKEYYKNPEATAEARAHGWHHTGDVGYKDDDGFIYISDRKKDMIITGGFNVFPREVEQVILTHPAVQDCAVVGVPDEKWGEAIKAVLQAKPGENVDEAEIIEMCKEKLGGVKAPKTVEVWDDLPRSGVGKLLKKDIRNKYWEGHSRRVG